jgi:hypothetical protein
MLVINLYGGPGSGKSTTAAGLFFLMKQRLCRAELITEYAKELTYENADMSNQLAILSEQEQRLRRLVGKVDYAVTDAPLLLSNVYAPKEFCNKEFVSLTKHLYSQYDNFNVFLTRAKPYARYGRSQTEAEAKALDNTIHGLLDSWHLTIPGNVRAPERIARAIGKF